MSVKIITEQINKFLGSDKPEVLSIKGKWGVGKTYIWNRLIKAASMESKIALDKYSYVSLFGLNSLNELKSSIFQQIIGKSLIGKEPNLTTLRDNTIEAFKTLGKKSLWLSNLLPFTKNFSPLAESIAFLSITQIIICIDDFERKGRQLDSKEILGLVSLLKERKQCKIVLIFNEESLAKDEDYHSFREKVIDTEILLEPTQQESIDIALEGNTVTYTTIKEYAARLGINNIRILKKIEKISLELENYLSKYDQSILNSGLHSATLFTWHFYSRSKDDPSLDDLINWGGTVYIPSAKESEKETKWKALLRKYGYQLTTEMDRVIADAVKAGYFDEARLTKEAEKSQKLHVISESHDSIKDSWNPFTDNFENNSDEVINSIYKATKDYCDYVSPLNLDYAVRLLRDLEKDDLANELIDTYISKRKQETEIFDLISSPITRQIQDEPLRKAFEKTFSETRPVKTLIDAIRDVAGKDSWHSTDTAIIEAATADELYSLLKAEKGNHLKIYVDTCLKYNPNNTRLALTQIGRESLVNKLRVKNFGIAIDDSKT